MMYERYERLRDERGLTDYRVAVETKIPSSTFYNWKAGRCSPKLDKVNKVARFFGVTVEYFLEDGNSETN